MLSWWRDIIIKLRTFYYVNKGKSNWSRHFLLTLHNPKYLMSRVNIGKYRQNKLYFIFLKRILSSVGDTHAHRSTRTHQCVCICMRVNHMFSGLAQRRHFVCAMNQTLCETRRLPLVNAFFLEMGDIFVVNFVLLVTQYTDIFGLSTVENRKKILNHNIAFKVLYFFSKLYSKLIVIFNDITINLFNICWRGIKLIQPWSTPGL